MAVRTQVGRLSPAVDQGLIKDGQHIEIRSRNDKHLTATYPRIAASALRLKADQAVVDGELVALDASGRPSFQALQHRGSHPGHQMVFYAFDLLHLDGRDVTAEPLMWCCCQPRSTSASGAWTGALCTYLSSPTRR